MGWSLGYDKHWRRDIGYSVPAICDYPGCTEAIDRGLSRVCGGAPYGGEDGCGLYFCDGHLLVGDDGSPQMCERCCGFEEPFDPKPDTEEWTKHKMTDPSWEKWRLEQGILTVSVDIAPYLVLPKKEKGVRNDLCFVCGIRPGVLGYSSSPYRMRCQECGEALCAEIELAHKQPKTNGVFAKEGPLEQLLTKGDLAGFLEHFTIKKENSCFLNGLLLFLFTWFSAFLSIWEVERPSMMATTKGPLWL